MLSATSEHTGLLLTSPKPRRQGYDESPRLMPNQHAVWRSGTSSVFSAVQHGEVWPSYSVNALTVSCLRTYRCRVVGAVVATMGYSSIRPTGWRRLRPPSTTSPDAPPSSQGEGGVKSSGGGVALGSPGLLPYAPSHALGSLGPGALGPLGPPFKKKQAGRPAALQWPPSPLWLVC